MSLSEIIIRKIKTDGPISFHDFMEMALYYPELGYYNVVAEKIGRSGDFYTSPCLTPVFGALIAKQLEEMWQVLSEQPFTIVEYGAGTGTLCHDILHALSSNNKLYEQLSYCIIEKSPELRNKQKQHLPPKVSWHNTISEIGEVNGCVLSNELVDNFAVHQVVMDEQLMEVFVDYKDDFVEVLQPASTLLLDYFAELGVCLPRGFRTEINLEATEWIKEIASALRSGFVLTIDYGYPSSELYRQPRSQGTLTCYRHHEVNDLPYKNIGQQDITSHVNFSALCHWGLKNGLICCALTNQAQFLLSLGYREHLLNSFQSQKNVVQAAKEAAVLTHTLMMDMGNKYKVLVQQKGSSRQKRAVLQGLTT